jgi:hypothetical protein
MIRQRVRATIAWLVVSLVIIGLALDSGLSPAEASDRWVGTLLLSANGTTAPFDFIVVVNPGVSASFEWRFQNLQIFTGALAAAVSGSTVTGTMFPTGGLATQQALCCRPCNFRGTIVGNRVDGTLDPVSCDGVGTFFLVKQ